MSTTPHGGDIQSYFERFGSKPLDYSANTNPLGISPAAKQAVIDALDEANQYPDPYCRQLRRALAKKENVPADFILCGNGAADLIFRLVLALSPQRALLLSPTFSEYEQSLDQVGCACEYFDLDEQVGFALKEGILTRITPKIDIVFLCEPNNPTGVCTDADLLGRIINRCKETETTLVVDECFNGFLAHPENHSLSGLLSQAPHLVLLKAFTKIYGMAGSRLGYLLSSNEELLANIQNTGQHWAVSSLAQVGGCAALTEREWLDEARGVIAEERPKLREGLKKQGYKVFESEANYLLFYSPDHELHEKLAHEGIMIRDCSNYRGLGKGYYRIAVRTKQENKKFLEVLSEVTELRVVSNGRRING